MKKHQWVDVNYRLPNDGEPVLCSLKISNHLFDHNLSFGFYSKESKMWYIDGYDTIESENIYAKVTHWMEIEPPKIKK